MLFLENYHPCHNEDIQKKEKKKKKKLREFLILVGYLQGGATLKSRGSMNPLTRKKKNLHI